MATDTHIGATLGKYRIEEYIGRGGMGVVYRAEHEGLGRRVALKLLAPELAENESFRERFVRESRLAAAIDHPNVIPIYEAGEAEGDYFIAMRYVDGVDLRQILHGEGPLDLERALGVLGQIAGALDAAHAAGLVHRDVKPGNILVTEGFDHCYLTDFGLTKAVSSDTNFTATGQFVGTTDYVAPEQIEGRELDRRTDVYSLGCVFYECLAGTPPFRRDSDMAVMWAHIQEPPPRLSARRPELPAHLDDVIATAMAKSKDDRYPSCSTFAAAARSALEMGTGRSFAGVPQPAAAPVAPPVEPQPAAEPRVPTGAFTRAEVGMPANVWQGPPEVGYVQPWAVAPAPAERGGKPLTAVALIVAALLLAGGGTAAALIATHKDKPAAKSAAVTTTVKQVQPAPRKVAPKPTVTSHAPAPTPTPEPQTPSKPTTPTPAPDGSAAEQALRDYWTSLANKDYATAYSHLDPSQALPESEWIHLRKKDGLFDVSFNRVRATQVSSTDATVTASFDTLQTSCVPQHWHGWYHLVQRDGEWLIYNHQLNHPSCN